MTRKELTALGRNRRGADQGLPAGALKDPAIKRPCIAGTFRPCWMAPPRAVLPTTPRARAPVDADERRPFDAKWLLEPERADPQVGIP